MSDRNSRISVRLATQTALDDVDEMVQSFVAGHPAQFHPRPLSRLQEAYFGANPVAHLFVASKSGRIVGMGQWTRMYDMFWATFGGDVEWLYVRPEARGLGIPAALSRRSAGRSGSPAGHYSAAVPTERRLPLSTNASQ